MKNDPSKETIETWNRLAALYHERFMDLSLYDHSYDFFLDQLPEGKTSVLEVGCGPGNITRYCLKKRPELSWLATDAAPDMLEIALRENPSAGVRMLDARDIAVLDGPFHAMVAGFCLPYLTGNETVSLIRNAGSLLADPGILYLSFVDGPPEQSGFQQSTAFGRCYFHYHRKNFILDACKKMGFDLLKDFSIPYRKSSGETETHEVIIACRRPALD